MSYFKYLLIFTLFLGSQDIFSKGKKVEYRKTQEVNFDGVDISGESRNPDGEFIRENNPVEFTDLYDVKGSFDKEIKKSIEYLDMGI